MEDLKFTAKFTHTEYLSMTIRNSAFDDLQNEEAEISFTLEIESYKNGISARFKSLDLVKLNYEGYFEDQDKWTPVEESITPENIGEWKVTTYSNPSETDSAMANTELLLKEIYVDVIKKRIDLTF